MEINISITRGHTVAFFKVVALGLILGFGIQFLFAWTAPTPPAPNGNVSGPLTTGSGAQTKASGDISLGGGGALYAGGLVAAPQLCIGSDCRAAWPAGGVGLSTTGLYQCPYYAPAGNGDHQAASSNCVGQITNQPQCHRFNCHKSPATCNPVAYNCTPL